MLAPFFTLAAVAPQRQRSLRLAAAGHAAALGAVAALHALGGFAPGRLAVGNLLLVAAIVEGALLVGWRLTQLPKSQALEFLLVSPLRPPRVFLAEAVVGLARLTLVTLAGLPPLVLLVGEGCLTAADIPILLLLPWAWGAVTGLGLAACAYESEGVRRWGERAAGGLVVAYLLVGVLAGENLPVWLAGLPAGWGPWLVDAFRALHEDNPFGAMRFAMEVGPGWAMPRAIAVTAVGLVLAGALLLRGAQRLHAHFQEEHYRPAPRSLDARKAVGDRPLTWWAVRRVSRYAGRINLWLAGGFGILYAAYTLAGPAWPAWLGRQVFHIFDALGGIPVVATALVLLSAVPAAFQYGLWDSNAQDRCRRLELLLLTGLDGGAYWDAAASAAWRRGRGYLAIALLLGLAAWGAGAVSGVQLGAGAASAAVVWGLYFACGFRAFTSGVQAGNLGLALTLGLPVGVCLAARVGYPLLAELLPPGGVYFGFARVPGLGWAGGAFLAGGAALYLARSSRMRCEERLRHWYDQHHGVRVLD